MKHYRGCEQLKNKRSVGMAISAFCLTACVLGMIGGMVLSDLRSGRTVFGDTYEQVLTQRDDTVIAQKNMLDLGWLPARCQLICRLPLWESQVIQWLLSRA